MISHADHAATLSHADHADFTDRLITLIDFSRRLFLICKIGRSEKISSICMPLRLTHADIADFTDRLIKQIGLTCPEMSLQNCKP